MREIKFRGWDGEAKRMWSWDELRNTHPLGCLYSHRDGSWEVMQFTGIVDSKGIDVYEGDIVQYEVQSFVELLDGKPTHKVTSVICWYQSELCWALRSPETDRYITNLTFSGDNGKFEVIGNIHQHADLLTKGGLHP